MIFVRAGYDSLTMLSQLTAKLHRASLRGASFLRRQRYPDAPWCNVCGFCGEFADPTRGGNLRESLVCGFCGSRSRDRMLIHVLGMALGKMPPLRHWRPDRSLRILETTGHGAHPYFLGRKFDYFNPRYDPEQIATGADPRRFADIQSLPYQSEFFDCVLSSDVFEHVRFDHKGFSEIHRVLKRRAVFVLQAPYDNALAETRILVEPRGDDDIFLEPPQYHARHTLVYRIYGRDLPSQLERHGFSVNRVSIGVKQHGISPQDAFLARKA